MADGKLTAMEAKKLTKPGFHNDGGGLYLKVGDGRKSWVFRYKSDGREHWIGLGAFDDNLAEARGKAQDCRRMLRDGTDPLEARREEKARKVTERVAKENDAARTFKLTAEKLIEAQKPGWKNVKHAAQWTSTLETYAYPDIGDKPVKAVTVDDVMTVLRPIWEVKPETASRVRGRIEKVLDYATAHGWRQGDNPARWKGNLDHLLAARSQIAVVEHHPAVPWADLPAIMAKLAESEGIAARCLRFATLTAIRSGEAREADWGEFDLAEKIWVIPAGRMKGRKNQKRDHRVPLTDAAVDVLKTMLPPGSEKPANGLVFPGGKVGKPLSDVALGKALRIAGAGEYTTHGMRSSFRDWVGEATDFPGEVAEAALAHKNKNMVEAAYLRSDFFEKRRRLMERWADHAMGVKSSGATITELRRA